jgi:hypothetical protein
VTRGRDGRTEPTRPLPGDLIRRPLASLLSLALLVVACAAPDVGTQPPAPTDETAGPDADADPEEDAAEEPDEPDGDEGEEDADDGEEDPDGPVEPPPAEPGYELDADETAPEAKQVAVDLVEALTTYEEGDDLGSVVARAAADDPELEEQLEDVAAPLYEDGAWSRGTIVYPQLAGLEPDEVPVMVVVEQRIGTLDGEVEEVSRVLDVRTRRAEAGGWYVEELASAGGEPVERPDDLPSPAEAVLDHPDIELPDTARWDIHAGAVDEELLRVMVRIADHVPYGVVVIDTGHPWNVWGTERASKHSEGLAVDVYRLDGPLVIQDRADGSQLHEFVRWLYDQPEIAEIGSPWALDGFGGRSFSDELHQDHVHIGVYRPGQSRP